MQLFFSCISILCVLLSQPAFSSLHTSVIEMLGYVVTASSVRIVSGAFYEFALVLGLIGSASLVFLWIAGIYSRAKYQTKIPRFLLWLSAIWVANVLMIFWFEPLYE